MSLPTTVKVRPTGRMTLPIATIDRLSCVSPLEVEALQDKHGCYDLYIQEDGAFVRVSFEHFESKRDAWAAYYELF